MKITKKKVEVHGLEQGFGTCEVCGKRTLGRSNALCSRCGGATVAECIGMSRERYEFLMGPRWLVGEEQS